jgi:hypothetical protein
MRLTREVALGRLLRHLRWWWFRWFSHGIFLTTFLHITHAEIRAEQAAT